MTQPSPNNAGDGARGQRGGTRPYAGRTQTIVHLPLPTARMLRALVRARDADWTPARLVEWLIYQDAIAMGAIDSDEALAHWVREQESEDTPT